MHYLRYFETDEEFQEVYVPSGTTYVEPWVSLTVENNEVNYNKKYIQFEDPEVERICMANFSRDGIGVTYEDAAAVTNAQFGTLFSSNTAITSFDELRYFTGLTVIAYRAFYGCSSLTSIVIPDNVVTIGWEGLNNLGSLVNLTIGRNCTGYGGCNAYAQNIYIDTLEHWLALHAIERYSQLQATTGAHLFIDGMELHDVVVPNGVTGFTWDCFSGFASLTSVYLPSSFAGFTGSYSSGFAKCTNLISANLKDANITTIGGNLFQGCSSLVSVVLPDALTEIAGWYIFDGCSSLTTFAFPPNLETLNANGVFRGCASLTSITSWGKIANFLKSDLNYPVLPGGLEHAIYLAPFPDTLKKLGFGLARQNYDRANIPWVAFQSTTPPELAENGLDYNGIQTIYVPYSQDHSILASYQSAENWTKYASLMAELNPDGTVPSA